MLKVTECLGGNFFLTFLSKTVILLAFITTCIRKTLDLELSFVRYWIFRILFIATHPYYLSRTTKLYRKLYFFNNFWKHDCEISPIISTFQVIVNAANIAKYECQGYFQNSRWNCSVRRDSEIFYGNFDDKGSVCKDLSHRVCPNPCITHYQFRKPRNGVSQRDKFRLPGMDHYPILYQRWADHVHLWPHSAKEAQQVDLGWMFGGCQLRHQAGSAICWPAGGSLHKFRVNESAQQWSCSKSK